MRIDKLVIAGLVSLSDKLDRSGLRKDADAIDQLVSRAARNESFEDLMSLFENHPDRSKEEMLEQEEDTGPGQVMRMPEEDLDLGEKELMHEPEKKSVEVIKPGRLGDLKRRNEALRLLKMRKMIDEELKELEPEVKSVDIDESPIADVETGFEDEEDDDDENDADDKNDAMETVINFVKEHPALLTSLLALI